MNAIHERLIRYWQASLITGGAGLLGGAVDAIANAVQGKKNRDAQALENEKNRQWQERMWEEHESPQAQAQNMRAAGLNPTGQVSSQSVGSASTASLPTPPPSTLGNSIARAGELVANSLHARRAHILEQDKFYHQQLIDWREQFRKELDSAKTREDYDSIIKQREESIEKSKVDRRFQSMLNDELEEARKQGYNRFKNEQTASDDAHSLSQAQIAYVESQKEYQDIMAKIAEEQNDEQKKVLRAQAESLRASAIQSLASAYEANVSAQLKSVQASNLKAQEKRDQEMHVIRKAAEEYARDLGASQAQIAELTLAMEKRWSSDIPVWGQVLDFIHHNLNLGGSVSKTFK